MSDKIEDLRIAPSRFGGDWRVKDYWEIDFETEEGWQRAITIFEDRIQGRFLKVIEQIEDYPYAGFAIMALDCLLIETLQQFWEGVDETPSRNSRIYFKNFLCRTKFNQHFKDQMAENFYQWIRNGILHQAEIKGSSRLLIRDKLPLIKSTQDGNGLIINRRKFHARLVAEFNNYVENLRAASKDSDIRKNFKKKMDFICKVNER